MSTHLTIEYIQSFPYHTGIFPSDQDLSLKYAQNTRNTGISPRDQDLSLKYAQKLEILEYLQGTKI